MANSLARLTYLKKFVVNDTATCGSAARSIEEVARWGETNRPKAPDAFLTDLENALKLIALHPDIGVLASNVSLEGVRAFAIISITVFTPEPAIDADMPKL